MEKYFTFLIVILAVACQQRVEYNYFEKYPNGQTKVEANYSNGFKNGKYQEYYENGKIKYQSNFQKGLQTDTTKYYNNEGLTKYIQVWNNGIPKELFECLSNDKQKQLSGTDDFYDKNLIIHNNLNELRPTLTLLDDTIGLDSMNVRISVPNCIRPHKVQLTRGKLKSVDQFGHILITDFNIDQTTISVGIMSIDGMLQLPEIPLSNINCTKQAITSASTNAPTANLQTSVRTSP
jgi:hypothetical protein